MAARRGQHLPALDGVLQPLFEHRQVQVLGGKLPVGGQGIQLLAQPTPFFQHVAELLLDSRQALAEFVAAGLQRNGATAFELLPDGLLRALRRQCQFDFAGDRFALAPQHVGPGALQRPLAKLLFVFDPGLDETTRGGGASAG